MVNDQGVKVHDLAANREYLLKIGRQRLRAHCASDREPT